MKYLLDTNILSPLIRNSDRTIRKRIAQRGPSNIATSVIVIGELMYGARKKASAAMEARIIGVTERMTILPLNEEVAPLYGQLRADLAAGGELIGANDLWIAAQALTESLTLVTRNEKEFRRVQGLAVENWAES